MGGVRGNILEVAVHGRIKGCAIDPDLMYTDEYDAHLHAAAEYGDVQYAITNDSGFHDVAVAHDEFLGYEVYTPDDFLMLVQRASIQCRTQSISFFGPCVPGRRSHEHRISGPCRHMVHLLICVYSASRRRGSISGM